MAVERLQGREPKLSPFSSSEGKRLQTTTTDRQELVDLIIRAEAQDAEDWLQWAERQAARLYPGDMEIVALWLRHEARLGDQTVVRTLRVVLLSLPSAELETQLILEALALADFRMGDIASGEARVARLSSLFLGHDLSRVEAGFLRALMTADQADRALDRAGRLQHVTDKALRAAVVDLYHSTGQGTAFCAWVQRSGGSEALSEPREMLAFLSALEAQGALGDCLAEGLDILERDPGNPQIAHLLRHVAHRLDRREEITPYLFRCADALAGSPAALELRALVALDADDYPRAWRILRQFEDPRAEDACRLSLTIATTDPAASGRAAWRAWRAYRRLAVEHAGPEMQFVSYLMNAARTPRDLKNALEVLRHGMPFAKNNPYCHRLYLSLLIACGHEAEARAHLAGLPDGLRAARLIREVALRFQQQDGDNAGVRQAWTDPGLIAGYRVLTAETDPPRPAYPAQRPLEGPVVVFAVVFNGIDYVSPFLAHYRALGVQAFVIVDNGSTDGTREALAAAPDVMLYDQPGSFRASAHGVAWINPLIQEHAAGRWALFVDIDEHLVFPGLDRGRSLADLVAFAEDTGAGCFPSFMLDMFATPATAIEGFAGHRFFDKTHVRFPSVLPPYQVVQGGVRGRLTGRQFLITKSPLVRVEPGLLFLENNHLHTHLPPSAVTTALLHYKFVGDAKARFEEAVERGEHFLGGRFYRDMLARLKGDGIRRGLWARQYQGDAQLVHLGLMTTTDDWDNWKA